MWSLLKSLGLIPSRLPDLKKSGGTRRKLLASLMALSLLCGGLGVAEASVHVEESGVTYEVYTTGETYSKETANAKLDLKADKTDVATNTANIANLENNKLSKADASNTYATKADVNTELANKADKTYVDTELTKKADVTALGEYAKTADVNTELANKADKTYVDTELTKKADVTALGEYAKTADVNTELANKADKTYVDTELAKKADQADLDTANGKITDLQAKTANLSADGKELTGMTTVSGAKVSGDNVEAGALKVTGAISDGAGVTTTLAKINDSMTQTATNTGDITDLKTKTDGQQTAINGLDKKTTKITYDAALGTNVDGVTFNAGKVTGVTSINGTEIGTKESGTYIHQDSSIWGNMKKVDTQVKTNADNIETNKNDITKLDAKVGTVGTGTYLDPIKSVGENLGLLDAGLKKEVDDRTDADTNLSNRIGTVTDDGNYIKKSATNNVSENLKVLDGELAKTNDRTGGITRNADDTKTTIEGRVTVDKDGNVGGVKDLTVDGKLNVGEIYLENNKLEATGKKHDSATSITADGISNLAKVTEHGHTTESQFTHNEKGTFNYATDKDGNKTYTKVTATENSFQVQDKDGKNKNHQVNTLDKSVTEIKNAAGATTKTEQTATDITNTAKDGTITNDANHIENTANTMNTTVTGQATESYGGLNTTVNGAENHTVTGKQTNKIDGNQENTIGGDQTTNVTGDILNTAKNITNEAETKLTDKVGTNTRVIDSTSITDTVGTTTNRKIEDGKITDTAGDSTVTTENGKGTTFAKTTSAAYSTKAGAPMDTNIAGNHITTGRVDANELGVSDKDGDNTADFSVEAGEGKGVKASAGNGTTTGSLDVKADEVGSSVKDASGKGSTFKQRIDAIMGNVKTDAGESEVTQKGDEITSVVGKGEATNSRVTQKKGSLEAGVTDGTNTNASYDVADASAKVLTGGTKVNKLQDNLDSSEKTITNGTYTTSKLQTALDITNTAKDGTITNDAKDIVNNASGNMTNTVGGDLTTTVSGNELHEVTGTKTENVTGKVTENYKAGQETNVTGDQDIYVTGKQTNKIDGDQVNIIGGNQTTTVTGDISNKAENITNEANTKLTDKVGDHTRVLDSEGITDTVGGSTFKQRIDKIMMESKDVSIKAEETLTNEAKVITNKASEVINNEAVNINNTATGIITSKASEIKNQADKLISNKVGENTWENMENGKITTSIKDGAKQNLTQSNAAGTTQSTVDVGKSTVTIQNADGLVDVVTDGTNTSVQNQTASQIAAAVKDEAGNENASVANATTSANTIKSGSKANTVISTADGTSFINSEAAAPVGEGTAVNTTIKGNTITTGKVTMDYAEVMKDLGVHGNAKVDQNLEVGGTSTLKGDVTMESNATVKKDLKVEGTTTTKTLKVTENAEIDGTLKVAKKATFEDSVSIAKDLSVGGDVTAKSYKVGDKTYIDANGINANDQKITNVADGSISEGSKDAVNGGQLYGVKRDLEHQVDKVGANAAAMANLRPMEFDPSSKWNIAAAIGNYGSETAAALGAFYRPNDDVMVNLSTAFGTGENMVGGGVSVRLGKSGNKLSREENNALKAQVDDLTARMDALLSVLNPNMSKDFPDVPENHWAYEAVSRLAGNDIVQGYPDGEFHGERTMTRYEMAEIIYNALSRGAEAERELVEEFKPELQAMAASEKATAEKAEG